MVPVVEDSADKKKVDAEKEDKAPGVSDKLPKSADPLTAGTTRLVAAEMWRFDVEKPLKGPLEKMPVHPFWRDEHGLVGVRVDVDDGVVIGLADAYPLSNLGISDADNGLLLANLVRDLSDRYPGQVAFDEYHHGFAQRDASSVAIAKLVFTGDWRWAVGQAILVGILALSAKVVRFGSPRDVTLKPRRQHREFAEAAGRLLDEAGATSLAAETLFRHYRERLCRLMDLEPQVLDRTLSEAVLARSDHEIAGVLLEARMAITGGTSRPRLLAITRKLHHVVEALEHGT
jgi:hypothetical protein